MVMGFCATLIFAGFGQEILALACIIHEKIDKNLKALCSLKHRDLSPTTVCDIYLLLTNNSLIIKNNSKK